MTKFTYWISDCRLYIARFSKDDTMPDVVEISTGCAWVRSRWKLTGFDDPRCTLPQFPRQPTQWSNLGRRTRSGGWIMAFSIVICEFDLTRMDGIYRPTTDRREVSFHHVLSRSHTRRRAMVDAAIKRVEANDNGDL